MNFLRVNAYYDIFTRHFGKIGFPLYRTDKKKPKKFFFNLDDKQTVRNNNNKDQSNKDVKNNVSSANLKRRFSVQQERIFEIPDLKKKVADLFSKVFLCIIGDIQYRLSNYKEETEDDALMLWRKGIRIPPHIKSFSHLNKEKDVNSSMSINAEDSESKNDEENDILDNNKCEDIVNNVINNVIANGSGDSLKKKENKEVLRGKNESTSFRQSANKLYLKESNSKEEAEEKSFKEENIEESKKDLNTGSRNSKKEVNSISEKSSRKKDEKIKKSENSDVTDATKSQNILRNQIKVEEKNDSQDFDDIDLNMDDEDDDNDDDTHIPKFFTKDKNIIQLNDYPEMIKDLDNQVIGLDSHNE
jgi:hypothetical protein